MVRLKFFFASPGHVDFLDCTNEISKCFECECEAFRLIKCAPQIYLKAIRMRYNETVKKYMYYKGVFCRKYVTMCLYTVP